MYTTQMSEVKMERWSAMEAQSNIRAGRGAIQQQQKSCFNG